uniref:Si:ch211-250n8.1 n=1 Tax=Hippocampus comes TaxID=109280 RepID=A0A3Q2YGF1_HIPCM
PVLNLVHRDYWQCFEQLPRKDTCGLCTVAWAVEQTKTCRKLISAQGRGRYLLRLALSRKTLPQFVTHVLHTPRVLEWYSETFSILRNEEFLPFMSLLLVLSQMEFKLDMEQNCSFLDESWLLPVCEIYEVVPCRQVGMVLYLNGRVFLLDMVSGGQAHVDQFISRGDVIDEINGICLRNSRNGQAGVVLSRLKGCFLSIRVVRWRARDGTVYRPLVKLLRALRIENPWLQLGPAPCQQPAANDQRTPPPTQCLVEGIAYIVQFLGDKNIGVFGTKKVLPHAISHVLQQNQPSKEVLLDLQETHVTCTESSSNLMVCQHHYPDISCVGRYPQPDYTILGFCVTNFNCVVLKAASSKECDDIICRITGFRHTEWFV